MDLLLQQIAAALGARKQTLATAESCTGGLLGGALTRLPGSSAWYLGGIVAYANTLKIRLLDVPEALLEARGAVSPETAQAMAAGARQRTGADYVLAITGLAGPDGGTKEKPVGLVFIALAGPAGIQVFEHRFSGSRSEIRAVTVESALRHLLANLTK